MQQGMSNMATVQDRGWLNVYLFIKKFIVSQHNNKKRLPAECNLRDVYVNTNLSERRECPLKLVNHG